VSNDLKPCPYCGSVAGGHSFTHRPLRLSDPEMAGAMQRLKDRIASDPAFALSLLISAGIANADGTLAEAYGGTAPGATGETL
jgi:hypothetical protein